MIAVRDHIDRDPHTGGYDELRAGMMDRLDQSPSEFARILKIKLQQARWRPRLVEGIDRLDLDRRAVRQKNKLCDRLARRKQESPIVKVDLASNRFECVIGVEQSAAT
jgi:hypothetical protein